MVYLKIRCLKAIDEKRGTAYKKHLTCTHVFEHGCVRESKDEKKTIVSLTILFVLPNDAHKRHSAIKRRHGYLTQEIWNANAEALQRLRQFSRVTYVK